MKLQALLTVMTVCILSLGCQSTPPPLPPPTLPTAAIASPIEVQRGPWNPDRVKAAEAILQTPARSELDRQRSALASAYLQWGEALFAGFEPVPQHLGAPPGEPVGPPPSDISGASSLSPLPPPQWYWNEKQQQDLDRLLQQQRDQYYRDRQPPPQFPRPPICNSYQVGGQVYTQCR